MELSKKQVSTMELIGKLGDKFGDDRWFTQYELPVTLHTMDALVKKGFLGSMSYAPVMYYRLIKRLGDES
jgi:hypothetical protein